MQGVLDEAFYYDGHLGAEEAEAGTHFGLWAPTAQSVELLIFNGPEEEPAESHHMQKGPAGSWNFQVGFPIASANHVLQARPCQRYGEACPFCSTYCVVAALQQ